MTGRYSVSVVIPTYNMAWCIERAIKSCQIQSAPVNEIIIVDDCSNDKTQAIVEKANIQDPRIRYFRKATNEGHLYALAFGIQRSTADWVALLDADDELTPISIASRVEAATRYEFESGTLPQLVYGDHIQQPSGLTTQFWRLRGYAYPFVCKELCLCQTSTIMLGKKALPLFPVADGWTTDDYIVLAISKQYPILHCDATVAIYHSHNSETRMSNSAKKRFLGVLKLVRDNRRDVLRVHGIHRLLLWYLRVLRSYCDYRLSTIDEFLNYPKTTLLSTFAKLPIRASRRALLLVRELINRYLLDKFDLHYF